MFHLCFTTSYQLFSCPCFSIVIDLYSSRSNYHWWCKWSSWTAEQQLRWLCCYICWYALLVQEVIWHPLLLYCFVCKHWINILCSGEKKSSGMHSTAGTLNNVTISPTLTLFAFSLGAGKHSSICTVYSSLCWHATTMQFIISTILYHFFDILLSYSCISLQSWAGVFAF